MIDLDEYLRADLHEPVTAVLAAARGWRSDPSTDHVLALRDAIDALARDYVTFMDAADKYMSEDGEAAEIRGGSITGNRREP